MDAFFIATSLAAPGRIGDKTQLLAFMLAARFRRPWPIVWGILVATPPIHAAAGGSGALSRTGVGPAALRWILGLSFIAMAGWMLVPDKLDEDDAPKPGHGVFVSTVIAFFLAEMGDKTQIATVALAARADAVWAVIAGTTVGMMIANVPAVLLATNWPPHPVKLVHGIAAGIFAVLGC